MTSTSGYTSGRLTVAPGARGAGFVFSELVKGGAVPRNYIPAVEQGARDAMEQRRHPAQRAPETPAAPPSRRE